MAMWRSPATTRGLAIALTTVAIGSGCSVRDDRAPTYQGAGATNATTLPVDICGTPNEGCPCPTPGQVVSCGTVLHQSIDYATCSMGHRTCEGERWGACIGDSDITTKRYSPGGLSFQGLAAPVACSTLDGGANPCDPYCKAYDDSASTFADGGGVGLADGGLVLTPDQDAGVTFLALPAGRTSCTPDRNLVGATCTPPGYATCQQDFHCDAATNTCLWNNGPGYYDPTIAGADITIGAPCAPAGSTAPRFPLCNRGSVKVPAGAVIKIHETNPPAIPDGCAKPSGPAMCTYTLPAALEPGLCLNLLYCNNSVGTKFLTVNQGPTGSQPATEAPGLCANNSAYVKTDGTAGCMDCATSCKTRVLGKVYDPSASPGALGNNVGLANVIVYQPSKPLVTFAPLPTCDTCASLQTPYVTAAMTDSTGSFVLNWVSPGTAVPIVVQSGRWRRLTTISVTPCVDNIPPPGTFHLPKNRTDGFGAVADIPKIAIATGNHDPLECLLLKMGIADTEMQRRVSASDANRIQLYYTNGTKTSTVQPTSKQLWNGTVNIQQEYSALILGCETNCMSSTYDPWWNTYVEDKNCAAMSSTERNRLAAFLNNGGRIFATHGGGNPFLTDGNPFASAASGWVAGQSPSYIKPIAVSPYIAGPAKSLIRTGTAAQNLFRDWMRDNGGSTTYGTGWTRVDSPWNSIASINKATTIEWLHGSKTNKYTGGADEYVMSMSFETPLAPAASCGRFVYSSMHTSPSRISGGLSTYGKAFPGACLLDTALTEEERALEYQIFQLTACSVQSIEITQPASLTPATIVRDYQGVCSQGERVRWAPLYWQASIPSGTSVQFRAATAFTQAELPASPPADAPKTALVGTAAADALAPAWDCEGCPNMPTTVDSQLLAQTSTPSLDWLRLYITVNPDAAGAKSPTLYNWRMLYDCIPRE